MFWVYLILSEHGDFYIGQTINLKGRLRCHNSPDNIGRTHGQRWRLVAAKRVESRAEALQVEREMEEGGAIQWATASLPRIARICGRSGRVIPALGDAIHLLLPHNATVRWTKKKLKEYFRGASWEKIQAEWPRKPAHKPYYPEKE
jgi:putative endonuclease